MGRRFARLGGISLQWGWETGTKGGETIRCRMPCEVRDTLHQAGQGKVKEADGSIEHRFGKVKRCDDVSHSPRRDR